MFKKKKKAKGKQSDPKKTLFQSQQQIRLCAFLDHLHGKLHLPHTANLMQRK